MEKALSEDRASQFKNTGIVPRFVGKTVSGRKAIGCSGIEQPDCPNLWDVNKTLNSLSGLTIFP
jgi:hypothetical protein